MISQETVSMHSERNALPAAPMAMPDQQLERARPVPLWRVLILPWLVWK